MLDTPGLADTGDRRQDKLYTRSITAQVEKYIDSITAVIILANGTVPRITVGTDDALSFLSTISPKIPVRNMCSILTNLPSPLSQNLHGGAFLDIPAQFVLDNPVALQKKYLKLKDDPNMKKEGMDLRTMVKAGEQKALEMLVDLFDWLDGLDRPKARDTLAQQMKRLLRKVIERGIWKVRRVFIRQ